ncbi:unnamed protein product, partial [Ectocarpus fasciculatus]
MPPYTTPDDFFLFFVSSSLSRSAKQASKQPLRMSVLRVAVGSNSDSFIGIGPVVDVGYRWQKRYLPYIVHGKALPRVE